MVSLLAMPTVSVIVLTRFQPASTALTVAVKGTPAVSAVGVPVRPEAVAGAAASPGKSTRSFWKAAALTATEVELVETEPLVKLRVMFVA